ncbi:MAG: DUF2382 domain-containing protein [Chamaesiphon sp.]|nr:DUF2382 domain-containing protein [Chamaesiphon sp.]
MIFKELKDSDQTSEIDYQTKVESISNILTQESFSLLEERLRVELTQRKIGEIVIRKEIETQVVRVEVPVRREKLIIEQVSPAYKLLAEIDLGQINNADGANLTPDKLMLANNDIKPTAVEFDDPMSRLAELFTPPTVSGSTDSLKAASELLNEIANLPTEDCGAVRIEIVLKDAQHLNVYQALVDRYCQA